MFNNIAGQPILAKRNPHAPARLLHADDPSLLRGARNSMQNAEAVLINLDARVKKIAPGFENLNAFFKPDRPTVRANQKITSNRINQQRFLVEQLNQLAQKVVDLTGNIQQSLTKVTQQLNLNAADSPPEKISPLTIPSIRNTRFIINEAAAHELRTAEEVTNHTVILGDTAGAGEAPSGVHKVAA